MALKIVFTEPAAADLADVDEYLRRRNPVAARMIVRGLYQRSQILLQQPHCGSLLTPHGDPDLRKLIYRSWLIVYRVVPTANEVVILRVWHAARGPVELED